VSALAEQCECCQKVRTDPIDVGLFGDLTDCNGKKWRICGKCIQVMWRKRAPRPEPIPV
jgi:hypothetical protein